MQASTRPGRPVAHVIGAEAFEGGSRVRPEIATFRRRQDVSAGPAYGHASVLAYQTLYEKAPKDSAADAPMTRTLIRSRLSPASPCATAI